jgi:hypothetical protein
MDCCKGKVKSKAISLTGVEACRVARCAKNAVVRKMEGDKMIH